MTSKCIESLTKAINEKLYYLDPMNTGSVENELDDEYYRLAEGIAQSLHEGIQVEKAVQSEFEFWFGEQSKDKLLSVCRVLEGVGLSDGI